MNAQTNESAVEPTAEAHFILVTTDDVLGSYADFLINGERVVSPISWHAETDAPTETVHLVLTLGSGHETQDITLTGDDWRTLEGEDLLGEFVDRMFAGEDALAVKAELVARAATVD